MATRKKRRKTAKRRTKRRTTKRRTASRAGTRKKSRKKSKAKRKATPKQMAALRKAWAARGITPGNRTVKKVSAAAKKANGKRITRMKNDGIITSTVADQMRAANRRGGMPLLRYIKPGDQAGIDFAGEFIGPRQERFIGPIHQPGKAKKAKRERTSHVSEFFD